MKFLKIVLLLALLMALAVSTLSTTPPYEEELTVFSHETKDDPNSSGENADFSWYTDDDQTQLVSSFSNSLRGANRFLAENKVRTVMTCNKYPRICRARGSPGPDCCKKKCVNVNIDRLNCGKCGNKCKYSETCCKGKCVNTMFDEKHCGGCSNKCKRGNICLYGLCNYA